MTTFECRRCGNCCRWHGYVRLTSGEVDSISGLLHKSPEAFIEQYTVLTADRRGLSLREREDGSCIFLEGNRCLIQNAKPAQCRDFPMKWNFPGWQNECCGILKEEP